MILTNIVVQSIGIQQCIRICVVHYHCEWKERHVWFWNQLLLEVEEVPLQEC